MLENHFERLILRSTSKGSAITASVSGHGVGIVFMMCFLECCQRLRVKEPGSFIVQKSLI
jgi:hypothetical protein